MTGQVPCLDTDRVKISNIGKILPQTLLSQSEVDILLTTSLSPPSEPGLRLASHDLNYSVFHLDNTGEYSSQYQIFHMSQPPLSVHCAALHGHQSHY